MAYTTCSPFKYFPLVLPIPLLLIYAQGVDEATALFAPSSATPQST